MSTHPDDAPRRYERYWQRLIRSFRVVEFLVTGVLLILAPLFSYIDVHERAIPNVRLQFNATTAYWTLDPSINQKKHPEQVPMWSAIIGGLAIPIIVNLAINYVMPLITRITTESHDTRDFLLSLLQSIAFSQILTQFIKNQTGRFRPSFYDMCGWQFDVVWDGVTNLCTDPSGEKAGRQSFPSGHSSYSWATMLLLTLYLLGRSRLSALDRGESIVEGGKKTLKLFVCFTPTMLATWVALTRSIDNWHHYSDILAGSIIGAVSACIAYSFNYGSIFSFDEAGVTREELISRRKQKEAERVAVGSNGRQAGKHHHAAENNWVVEVKVRR